MNKKRRSKIKECSKKLSEIQDELQAIQAEEEDALDNIPENLQGSYSAYDMEEVINDLEEALTKIEETIDFLSVFDS